MQVYLFELNCYYLIQFEARVNLQQVYGASSHRLELVVDIVALAGGEFPLTSALPRSAAVSVDVVVYNRCHVMIL